jgi:hypothetical protein
MRFFVKKPSMGIVSIALSSLTTLVPLFLAYYSYTIRESGYVVIFCLMTLVGLWNLWKLGIKDFLLTTVQFSEKGIEFVSPELVIFLDWQSVKSVAVCGYYAGLSREPWICISKEETISPFLNRMQTNERYILIAYRKKIVKSIKMYWAMDIEVAFPGVSKEKVNG